MLQVRVGTIFVRGGAGGFRLCNAVGELSDVIKILRARFCCVHVVYILEVNQTNPLVLKLAFYNKVNAPAKILLKRNLKILTGYLLLLRQNVEHYFRNSVFK